MQAALDPAMIARGEDAYQQCKGCHSVTPGARSGAGPNLYGVVGRKAGSLSGYPYTQALKDADVVWDAASLDAFLADPSGFVPGSEMKRGAVRNAESRAAIAAYLVSLKGD